jgi:hypothetical protein
MSMKKLQILAAALSLAAVSGAFALETGSAGKMEYACGGAGVEERADMKVLESVANASMLFVTEQRGGYLADVDFLVRDSSGTPVLEGRADGPYCLLRVPAGRYKVEATYGGVRRTASVVAARDPGKPTRARIAFPRDPSETIMPTAEERASSRSVALSD